MPQGVTIPNTFLAETAALADQINANFAALQAKFGGIVDGDIAATPDLDGGKLSQTSGKQVPTAALANQAVTSGKLANDTNDPGSDALRAVTGDHIATITSPKMTRILTTGRTTNAVPTLGIPSNKLGISIDTSVLTTLTGIAGGGVTSTTVLPTAGVNAYTTANYDLIGLYLTEPSFNTSTTPVTLTAFQNAGLAWNAKIVFAFPVGLTASMYVVFVFMRKA